MQDIASKTGGLSFIPSSADSLPGVTAQIMAHYLNTEPVTPDFNDGNIDFNVDNKSIYSLYIHIFSNKSIKDINPILTAPSGYQISLDGKNVKVTSTNSYTLIKLFSPDVGRWNLKLTGVTNKNCTVSLTTVYSIFLKQSVNPTSVTGGKTQITATLNNSKGRIDDSDLLKTLTVAAEISGAENKNVPLSNDGKGNFTGEFLVSNGGTYTIVTKAVSSDKKFNKESEAFSFEAVAPMGNDMVVIEQTLSAKEIHSGESVTVSVRVKNKETGEIITLPDCIMTAYLKDKEGNNISDVPLKKNDSDTYEGTIPISEKGDYKIVTVATDNATGNTKSSTETRLLVTRPSMILKNSEPIYITVDSLPFSSSEIIDLTDIISFEVDDVLEINLPSHESEYYEIVSYKEGETCKLKVTGLKVGSDETSVVVKNQYGEEISLRLIVNVESRWLGTCIFVVVVIVIIVVLLMLLWFVRAPGSFKIELVYKGNTHFTGTETFYPRGRIISVWFVIRGIINMYSDDQLNDIQIELLRKLRESKKSIKKTKLYYSRGKQIAKRKKSSGLPMSPYYSYKSPSSGTMTKIRSDIFSKVYENDNVIIKLRFEP